jgi:hypothetical protein
METTSNNFIVHLHIKLIDQFLITLLIIINQILNLFKIIESPNTIVIHLIFKEEILLHMQIILTLNKYLM